MNNIFQKLAACSFKRVELHGARYLAFGIFSVINYMLPLYMWSSQHTNNTSVLIIRSCVIILNFLLTISEACSENFKKYLPLFWHFTICFSLPFFTTYMTLLEGPTLFWIINATLALMLGVILLDFISFFIIFPIGITLAIVCIKLLNYEIHTDLPTEITYSCLYLLLFVLTITLFFFKDNETIRHTQENAMKKLASAIAHEVRTPISTIMLLAKRLTSNENTNDTSQHVLNIKTKILKEIGYVFTILDMMIVRLRPISTKKTFQHSFISELVDSALMQYPFLDNDKALITIKVKHNFYCYINEYLLINAINNLLQNAIYQIKQHNRGSIIITAEIKNNIKMLSIQDNAIGIKSSYMKEIFRPFITNRPEGTGVGLHFCKNALNSMNCDIVCESIYEKYANFIIQFP